MVVRPDCAFTTSLLFIVQLRLLCSCACTAGAVLPDGMLARVA